MTNSDSPSTPFSLWKVLTHPSTAVKVLGNYERMVCELSVEAEAAGALKEELDACNTKLNETLTLLEEEKDRTARLKADVEKLNESVGILVSECGRERNNVKRLENELEAARSQSKRNEEVEAELREFEKSLDKVAEMKAKYEKRIALLRAAVTELRQTASATNNRRNPAPQRRDDNDWLESLPE